MSDKRRAAGKASGGTLSLAGLKGPDFMKTFANVFVTVAVLLLLGVVLPTAVLAQTRGTNQDIRYAVESGGADTGACWVTAPCTVERAIEQANNSGAHVDTIAVRVRRAGDTAVLGNVSIADVDGAMLAVYNEVENSAFPYLLKGNLEVRGNVTLTNGTFLSYSGDKGMLKITGSDVSVSGRGFFGGNFAGMNRSGVFQGNVVFAGTTTITQGVGNCAAFQSLRVASSGKVTLDLSCTTPTFAGTSGAGIHVTNVLDVRGQLMLENGRNLNLIARRPITKADSALSAPEKLPGAYISGSISGTGMFTVAVEAEQVATTDTVAYWGAGTSATAIDAGDTVRAFVASYTGWPNATFKYLSNKSKLKRIDSDKFELKNLPGGRFMIGGSGSIYMDLMKTTQAGAEIQPSFGNGGISMNEAGVLIVKGRTVRGHFVNSNQAQTEFTGSVTIDRDMIVESYTADASGVDTRGGIGTTKASAALYGGSPIRECYGESGLKTTQKNYTINGSNGDTLATARGLTTGIYFRGFKSTLGGALLVRNGFKTTDGCYGGVYALGATNVTYDVIGLDAGVGAAAPDWAHFMIERNFTIEGDLDLDAVSNVVTRRAPATTPRTTGRTAGNICTKAMPKATGAHVVFTGGQALQTISLADDLALSGIGIKVDKTTSQEVEITGGHLTTQSVDIQGGFLTTNGMLDIAGGHLLINQNQGAVGDIRRGTGDKAYTITKSSTGADVVHVPETITYTGSLASMDTGDELYAGMKVKNVEMYLGTASTKLTVLTNVTVATSLALTQGMLDLPSGISLKSPSTLTVGNGYVNESGGTWTTAQAGTITFVGETSRTTDNIVPAYTTFKAAQSGKLGKVVVDGCSSSKATPPPPLR